MKTLKNVLKKCKWFIIIIAITTSSLLTFSFVSSEFEIAKNLDIFGTLYKQLYLYYVDDIKPAELMKTGIDAMLESLDPYTTYITESEVSDYEFMTTGQYGGIGALIHKQGDYVVISDPYEGFPADKAGLKAGDIIISIENKPAKGKQANDISALLKGQPGTTVNVVIQRGDSKPIEKTITREEIKIDNVSYVGMIDSTVGYIRLSGFTQSAAKETKAAFLKLKENSNLQGVIIDLRGNGGGLLNEAVEIANIFVDKDQLIVSTQGKVKERNTFYKTINVPVDANIPLAILVDEESASASEILAGAIQDLDRGIIIGQKTFGKGLVQNVFPLSYNTKVKITVAKYYIPSGRCIQAIDYSHKNKEGDAVKIPDSLIHPFKTKNGRTVYDGGGIQPDVLTDAETFSNISASLVSKYIIFDYATKYYREHSSIVPARTFVITDAIYADFTAFLKDKTYDYTTKSEKQLDELKKIAENEKYFQGIQPEYEALKTKLKHDKEQDLIKFKEELKKLLKAEIAGRYYYQKGRVESILDDDADIKKATVSLKNKQTYKSILSNSHTLKDKKNN